LGFKDYQLRDKNSIERFIQLVFSVWAAILFWEIDNPSAKDGSNPRTMGEMIDQVKMQALGETFEYIMTYFNTKGAWRVTNSPSFRVGMK